jgi:hypothetical protein
VSHKGRHRDYQGQWVGFQERLKRPDTDTEGRKSPV